MLQDVGGVDDGVDDDTLRNGDGDGGNDGDAAAYHAPRGIDEGCGIGTIVDGDDGALVKERGETSGERGERRRWMSSSLAGRSMAQRGSQQRGGVAASRAPPPPPPTLAPIRCLTAESSGEARRLQQRRGAPPAEAFRVSWRRCRSCHAEG